MPEQGRAKHNSARRAGALESYAKFIARRPAAIVACSLVVSAVMAWIANGWLTLDANTDSLIRSDRPFMVLYRSFLKEFGDLEYVYVAIDSKGDRIAAERAVDALLPRLRAIDGLEYVEATITPPEQWRMAPRAMEDADLAGLLDASLAFGALVDPSPSAIATRANELLGRLSSEGLVLAPQERRALGASALFLVGSLAGVDQPAEAPWLERKNEYLVSGSGRLFFIEVLPTKEFTNLTTIEDSLAAIRLAINETAGEHPAVEMGLTGKPVLQADELATTNLDMTRGTLAAAVIIALLTITVLRRLVPPLLAMFALGVAFAATYGAAALLVGRLNLLSLVFMIVLVSAGIDYGIHFIARAAELRKALGGEASTLRAVTTNSVPIWTGALTSAIVFFVALLTDFGGLQELGVIAGTGLLLCAMAMTLTLPAALVLYERWRAGREAQGTPPLAEPQIARKGAISALLDPPAGWVIIAAIAGISVLGAWLPGLKFESNLLNLQSEDLDSVRWERRVLEDSQSASWFAGVMARTEEEVAEVSARARQQAEIGEVRSVLDIVKRESPERSRLRSDLGKALAPLMAKDQAASQQTGAPLTPAALDSVSRRLRGLATLGALSASADELEPLRRAAEATDSLAAKLKDPALRDAALVETAARLRRTHDALASIGEGSKASLRECLPAAIAPRLVSPDGALLVSLVPREDVWEFAPLERFIAAIRAVSPEATGVPITVYESVIDMRVAFILMSTLSIAAIALLVWLDFRSVIATATCMCTLIVGMLWTLGAMSYMGVSLNLANFFGVPMLLGLGIDASVHLMHRARETGDARSMGWTMRAVVISSATTVIGFGTLLFASHRGLQSLGWLIVIGSVATLGASVVLLPAVLRRHPELLGLKRPKAD